MKLQTAANPGRPAIASMLLMAVALGMLAVSSVGCGSAQGERPGLLVFAAASLADVLSSVAVAFEKETGVEVLVSYGGSQMMARQIASGAPADLFIAAGEFPVTFLESEKLVGVGPVALLRNRLVLTSRAGGARIDSVDGLGTEAVKRMAIADPELAPAGRYARQALEAAGLWGELQDKLVMGPDVRAVLTYVATGNVDVAIVYETDVRIVEGLVVLGVVPPDSYGPIVYPAVVIDRPNGKSGAAELLAYLRGDDAGAIFRSHGFDHLGR